VGVYFIFVDGFESRPTVRIFMSMLFAKSHVNPPSEILEEFNRLLAASLTFHPIFAD